MSTGWIVFIVLIVMGFVDLAIGVVFSRTANREVGAPPTAGSEDMQKARRLTARVTIVSAFLFWALAAASATGFLNPDYALPIFTQSVPE